MFKLVVIGFVMALAAATPITQRAHPINSEMVSAIRAKASTWEAHDPETNPLREYTREQLLELVGTYVPPPRMEIEYSTPSTASPSNWDPRTDATKGKCIHPIRDQAQCGSCWAFGSSEALSDRFCQAGTDVILAPQDLVSCDTNNYGCNGGYMFFAWLYLTDKGAVTEACMPYASADGNAPACPKEKKCADGSTWKKYKCAKNSRVNPTEVGAIQDELYNNGPMEGAFTVYEDFMSYKKGIYQHTTGGQLGGHAIKVIGYGVEDGTAYWLCANSWSAKWGMDGFFKIKQGDCGINQQMWA